MSAIITDIASPFLFFLSDITYEELTPYKVEYLSWAVHPDCRTLPMRN